MSCINLADMRAMLLESNAAIEASPLHLVDLADPEPGPGEVRLKVRLCAICRTDLHVIEGELPRETLPIIPGHQIVGEVDRLGPGCTTLRPGQRVGVPWLHSTCGNCEYCRAGKENLCESSRYTGYDVNGGFAEYTIAREDFVYPLASTLPDLTAAPLLCAGIIGFRALQRADLPKAGSLGIFGFGSSAHLVIQLAQANQARVLVVTRSERHQGLARALGASWAGGSARELPEKLDSAIIFAPAGELVPQALESLRKGGTLAIAGIHLSEIPQLDYQRHLFFERDLRSVTANTRADGRALFEQAATHHIEAHTTCYRLEDANRALQDLKADRLAGTGVLEIR